MGHINSIENWIDVTQSSPACFGWKCEHATEYIHWLTEN